MITPWSLSAWAVESIDSTLAPTAASMGAATLAFAVDRGGRVDGQVDVRIEVEDGDDLLVGEGGRALCGELLVRKTHVRLFVVHFPWSPFLAPQIVQAIRWLPSQVPRGGSGETWRFARSQVGRLTCRHLS